MNDTGNSITAGLATGWAVFMAFVPKLLLFAAILLVGYFVARLVEKLMDAVLERVGFDRLVERGGVKRALERSNMDASSFISKLAFYGLMLFALQLAFGVFGPNPISDLLTRLIAYLPNIFYAAVIVIIGSAVAAGVKRILQPTLGNLSFGKALATGASAAIMVVAVFAALSELNIAPAIINGLFYAGLFVIAGSLVISVGVGGIGPMRGVWEKALNKVQAEAPKVVSEMSANAPKVVPMPAQTTTPPAGTIITPPTPPPTHEEEKHESVPRFKT
ncbi:MAG TPA: hypothetical protein VMZ27_05530 [Candidatus Saccharimonadales bacterium]|nr:hypothetical protein [Candidatus Saccharimonadales bacterium]